MFADRLPLPLPIKLFNLKQEITNLTLNKSSENIENMQNNSKYGSFPCSDCGRIYKLKSSLRNHRKWECGKEPQFECLYCSYKAKQKMHMMRHMERMHQNMECSSIQNVMDFNIDD